VARSFVKEARRRVGPKRARIREIIDRLGAAHPDATIALKSRSPLELLVAVMLSAQTTDVNVNRVTISPSLPRSLSGTSSLPGFFARRRSRSEAR
jgi:hypothetical protein